MDIMTILGILIGGGSVYYVMMQGQIANLLLDLNSAILVFGGTLGCALITYPWKIVRVMPRAVLMMFFPPRRSTPDAAIREIVRLAESAKRVGIESMQDEIKAVQIPFLRDALQMVIDGLEPETVYEKLDKEIAVVRRRHFQVSAIFRSMGSYAPIFGLLGTLIGVVQVLRNLTDAQQMGASMAIAITTTFYGVFGANFVFLPIAGKLAIYSEDELIIKELLTRGVVSIQKGDVPLVIERKLEAYLSYRLRVVAKPSGVKEKK